MNISNLESLSKEYQSFLLSDVDDDKKKSILHGHIADFDSSINWNQLYEKTWKVGGSEVKDFASYAKAVANQKNKLLSNYIDRLDCGVPFSSEGDDPLEKYEDMNCTLEEAYQTYDLLTLITLNPPKHLEDEHAGALNKVLSEAACKKLIDVTGPSDLSLALSENSLAQLLVLISSMTSDEIEFTLKNINLDDTQLISLLAVLPLNKLISLNLEGNRISARGATALADALLKIENFRLKLDNNLIGEIGVLAFLPLLKDRSIILEVRGVGVDTETMKEIEAGMGKRSLSQIQYT